MAKLYDIKKVLEMPSREENEQYHLSDEWKQRLLKDINFQDVVRINYHFACRIFQECEEEYRKTDDLLSFVPLDSIYEIFDKMFTQVMSCYEEYVALRNENLFKSVRMIEPKKPWEKI